MGFFVGLWNAILDVLPVILHAACEITKNVTDAAKLGGGS